MFEDARTVGVDGEGRIYVGEYLGGRVQVFDSAGQFISQWLVDGEFALLDMTVGRDGTVYIVQRGDICWKLASRVQSSRSSHGGHQEERDAAIQGYDL